jgi:hypothetical protein
MFQSFRRQYADNQEQERAENILQRGIRMQGEDLDAYIAKYEGLVLEAGFNLHDRLCLKMFTDGLCHVTRTPCRPYLRYLRVGLLTFPYASW